MAALKTLSLPNSPTPTEGHPAKMATKRKPKLLPPGEHEMRVGQSFNVPDGCHARIYGFGQQTVKVLVYVSDPAAYQGAKTEAVK